MTTPLTASDIESLHDQVISFFNEKWELGSENERYQKVKNWKPEHESKIKAQGRQPYSIPIAMTKLNTVYATQKQARTQYKVEAKVDPNDEVKAEVATLMLRDDEKSSKLKYIESEVFQSGTGVQYGVAKAYVDYTEILPRIRFKKLDYKNVVWDINSREYGLEDALWTAELDRMYRWQYEQQFKKDINGEDLKVNENTGNWGREKNAYYVTKNPNGKSEFDIITVIYHLQKVSRQVFYVVHPNELGTLGDGVYMKKFSTQEEADKHLREINIPYIVNGLDFMGEVQPKDITAFDKYTYADGRIIKYEQTDFPSHQVKVFRCFHFEDDFWSFMDVIKSPQIFYDRLIAQIDYSFGTDIKTVFQLNVNALAEGTTFEQAKKIIEQTGGVVPSNSNEEIVRAVKAQGINPQWLQMATIMQGLMEDFAGGRSFSGLGDGSGESGRAINLKKQQGALVAFLMLDNLARWKQSLGEFALFLHKEYDSVERQIKVQGAELSPEMLQLLNSNNIVTPSQSSGDSVYVKVGGIDFLKDVELELTVTEAALTESEKEFKYMQLVQWGQSNPAIQALPAYNMILLEYNPDIPNRLKKQLIQELTQANQQQQEMQQQELNIKKAGILQDGINAQLQHRAQTMPVNNNK